VIIHPGTLFNCRSSAAQMPALLPSI